MDQKELGKKKIKALVLSLVTFLSNLWGGHPKDPHVKDLYASLLQGPKKKTLGEAPR